MIYLEAGSGAKQHVSTDMIKEVKQQISIPLIVGGGIRTTKDLTEVLKAGADMVVIGNLFEKDINLMKDFTEIVRNFN